VQLKARRLRREAPSRLWRAEAAGVIVSWRSSQRPTSWLVWYRSGVIEHERTWTVARNVVGECQWSSKSDMVDVWLGFNLEFSRDDARSSPFLQEARRTTILRSISVANLYTLSGAHYNA
jgi:hypothetical protein